MGLFLSPATQLYTQSIPGQYTVSNCSDDVTEFKLTWHDIFVPIFWSIALHLPMMT